MGVTGRTEKEITKQGKNERKKERRKEKNLESVTSWSIKIKKIFCFSLGQFRLFTFFLGVCFVVVIVVVVCNRHMDIVFCLAIDMT